MDEKRKISVIIPAYNAERFLGNAIASVVNQSHKNIEIIIINDGSTDGTKDILNQAVQEDPRIHVITTENQGVSHARNLALDAVTGEYVFFLDADDYLELGALEQYLLISQQEQADIVLAPYFELFTNGSRRVRCNPTNYGTEIDRYGNSPLDLLFVTDYITWNVWGKLMRTDLIKEIRFDETLRIAEDLYFLTAALEKCQKIGMGEVPLYCYRIHGNSVMKQSFSEKNLNTIQVLQKIYNRYRDSKYSKTVKGFYLKYNIWFYGFYLRTCRVEDQKSFSKEMAVVRQEIKAFDWREVRELLSWKKQVEYASIVISPMLYKAWIGGAYAVREQILNCKKKG